MRFLGAVILVAGLALVAQRYPSVPSESWDSVHQFRFDEAECRTLRESRETATFVCPELDEPVTIADAARRFRLELALICLANELPADCGAQQLEAGESLILPLARDGRLNGSGPKP